MDLKENERLSNLTLRHKLKEQSFYCCYIFI